jgi:hypothetical protein
LIWCDSYKGKLCGKHLPNSPYFQEKNSEISIFRQKSSIFLLELYPNLADFFVRIITNVAKSQNQKENLATILFGAESIIKNA